MASLDKKSIQAAVEKALAEGKGKRKFKQSFDLAVNFKDIDFKKAENRLSVDVVLPIAPRPVQVAVFADGQIALDAKKAGVEIVIAGADIPTYVTDKTKQKQLLQYSLLATPPLMGLIGKQLGQVLGAKGKLPKPILPNSNLVDLVEKTRRTVNLKTKGKFLPCVHCIIGNEEMTPAQLTENVLTVVESLLGKIQASQIKSLVLKTTMGTPVKIN